MGEDIIVEFDIDAREWQGRWFTSINAYRITRAATSPINNEPMMQEPPFAADPFGSTMPQAPAMPQAQQASPFDNSLPSDPGEDLPF